MTTRLALVICFALIGFGCASDTTSEPPPSSGGGGYGELPYSDGYGSYTPPPAAAPTPSNSDCVGTPTYAQMTIFSKCSMCHSATRPAAQRNGAPAAINFDTEADADAHADRAVSLVMSGIMPPAGAGVMLTAVEKQQLYDWAMCKM